MTHPGLGLKNLFIWKGLVRTEPLNSAGPLVSVGEEAGTLTEAPLGASGGPRGWAVLVPRGESSGAEASFQPDLAVSLLCEHLAGRHVASGFVGSARAVGIELGVSTFLFFCLKSHSSRPGLVPCFPSRPSPFWILG